MKALRTALVFALGFLLGAMAIHSRTAAAQGSGSLRVQQVSPGGFNQVNGTVVGFSCASDGRGVDCYAAVR